MAKTVQRPPSNRAALQYEKQAGVHYTMGHELPEDITAGDGPIDRLLERGYDIVAQKGRQVILACDEDKYEIKRKNAMIESENRLKPRNQRREELVSGKDDPVSTSIEGVERQTETLGEMIESLPLKSE